MKQEFFKILKVSLAGSAIVICIFYFLLFADMPNLRIPLTIKRTNYYIGLAAIGILILSIILLQFLHMKSGIILGIFADIILGYYIVIVLIYYYISPIGLFYFIPPIKCVFLLLNTAIHFNLLCSKLKENESNITRIRKVVIDLGTQYTKLSLGDISEKCGENNAIVLETIKDMIKNNKINAKYFKSSRMVAFDQQANIDDFDTLMKIYEEWENDQTKKT